MTPARSRAAIAADAIETLATGVWIGGLLALGAITAPQVFNELPRPDAAPLMTSIFRHYDRLVLVFVMLVAMSEVARVLLCGLGGRLGVIRASVAGVLCVTGLLNALWVSPKIEAFLAQGAQRGVGDLGKSMDAWHKAAESIAKGTVFIGAALVVLILIARTREPAQ